MSDAPLIIVSSDSHAGMPKERWPEIAPSVDHVLGHDGELRPRPLDSYANRGGYLEPAERGARLDEDDALLRGDLVELVGAR